MQSKYRLKKNHQYNYVFKHAKSVADKSFALFFCKVAGTSKTGFSISKKYGKAVQRNRLRRQLKAVVREVMPGIASGYNLIVVPRAARVYTYAEIVASMKFLFGKAGVLK